MPNMSHEWSARTDGTGATAAAATSASAGAAFGDCRVAVPTRQALATCTTNALNGTSTRRLGVGVWLIMLSLTSCTVIFSSSSLFIDAGKIMLPGPSGLEPVKPEMLRVMDASCRPACGARTTVMVVGSWRSAEPPTAVATKLGACASPAHDADVDGSCMTGVWAATGDARWIQGCGAVWLASV